MSLLPAGVKDASRQTGGGELACQLDALQLGSLLPSQPARAPPASAAAPLSPVQVGARSLCVTAPWHTSPELSFAWFLITACPKQLCLLIRVASKHVFNALKRLEVH